MTAALVDGVGTVRKIERDGDLKGVIVWAGLTWVLEINARIFDLPVYRLDGYSWPPIRIKEPSR